MGAVRVGVVSTHQPVDEDQGDLWLPGAYRGGAELSDAEYLAAAPDGVEWAYTTPGEAAAFDRVLVTSIDLLTPDECDTLARLDPVVFLHHAVAPADHRVRLLNAARVLMVHTPAHRDRTLAWASPRRVELVLSAMDTSIIGCASEREPFALAASRNHPLKGLKNARVWAASHGYRIVVMTREPRDVVLDAMSRAEVFVHLPLAFESECRSVIEAVLSGCRVATNANVGVTSVPGWDDPSVLRPLVDAAAATYWGIVCESR